MDGFVSTNGASKLPLRCPHTNVVLARLLFNRTPNAALLHPPWPPAVSLRNDPDDRPPHVHQSPRRHVRPAPLRLLDRPPAGDDLARLALPLAGVYHAGRITAYLAIGTILALLGSAAITAGRTQAIQVDKNTYARESETTPGMAPHSSPI